VSLPALAIPMADKTQFVCPAAHQAMIDDVLPLTTAVLAIGWRAGENHFLQRLNGLRPGVPVWVVSPNSARETVRRLMDVAPRSGWGPQAMTFSQFRESDALQSFLGSALSETSS
jgi:hypothetical protein